MNDFFNELDFKELAILKENYNLIFAEVELALHFFNEKQVTIKRNREDWIGCPTDFLSKYYGFQWIKSWSEGCYNLPMIYNNTVIGDTVKYIMPNTIRLLTSLKGIQVAGLSLLTPYSTIYKHDDSTGLKQGSLAYHLCLIGEGNLYVNDKLIQQIPGKVIIFNSNKLHYVNNITDSNRVILYISFMIKEHTTNKKIISLIPKQDTCVIA